MEYWEKHRLLFRKPFNHYTIHDVMNLHQWNDAAVLELYTELFLIRIQSDDGSLFFSEIECNGIDKISHRFGGFLDNNIREKIIETAANIQKSNLLKLRLSLRHYSQNSKIIMVK